KARSRNLLKFVPGPDFPTGGVVVDSPEAIAEAYATGRGSFRVRARWHKEETGRGTYVSVVTEIPWLVQKSRLMERLGELLNEKKLPLVADAHDESAEDVRLVIEPRARTVDPALLMESLFKLTDGQADAILNMRLRNLRHLHEMGIRQEDKNLRDEKNTIEGLLRSDEQQWKTVADQIKQVRATFGPKTPLGKRRTSFALAPEHDEAAIEAAMVEREPVTVVVSDKGWIRALRGHVSDLSAIAFKADDRLKLAFFAETTSKLLVFATNGRFYTIEASKLPGGRGHGEPV